MPCASLRRPTRDGLAKSSTEPTRRFMARLNLPGEFAYLSEHSYLRATPACCWRVSLRLLKGHLRLWTNVPERVLQHTFTAPARKRTIFLVILTAKRTGAAEAGK